MPKPLGFMNSIIRKRTNWVLPFRTPTPEIDAIKELITETGFSQDNLIEIYKKYYLKSIKIFQFLQG